MVDASWGQLAQIWQAVAATAQVVVTVVVAQKPKRSDESGGGVEAASLSDSEAALVAFEEEADQATGRLRRLMSVAESQHLTSPHPPAEWLSAWQSAASDVSRAIAMFWEHLEKGAIGAEPGSIDEHLQLFDAVLETLGQAAEFRQMSPWLAAGMTIRDGGSASSRTPAENKAFCSNLVAEASPALVRLERLMDEAEAQHSYRPEPPAGWRSDFLLALSDAARVDEKWIPIWGGDGLECNEADWERLEALRAIGARVGEFKRSSPWLFDAPGLTG